jgi:glycosyltransferase involved in cell wall biosynthesis
MSLKVLYTAFDVVPSPKGASRHITHFTQALVAGGYEVTVFTAGLAHMPTTGTFAGARIIRHTNQEDNFLRRALCFGDAVWEHLRAQEGAYDIIHFRDIWSGAAAVEARGRFGYPYRTLFEVNGLPSVELKYHYPALRESPVGQGTGLPQRLKAQEQALLRQVDAIVCVSCVTAIYLQSLGASSRLLAIIPNGVDPACFRPANGLAVQPPRLVYVGTLATWQGVSTLIEAMPTILAAFPEAELHLIGPAKSRQQKGLLKLVSKLGLTEQEVRFLGPVSPEEIPEYLKAASVCLTPLPYNDRNVAQGCCPIKLLEYAAAARPIVASDLPVIRELLGEGEVLFFQPGDAADLARRTIYLLSHPAEAQAMGVRAAQRVSQAFTWERAGELLLGVYSNLVRMATPRTLKVLPSTPGPS